MFVSACAFMFIKGSVFVCVCVSVHFVFVEGSVFVGVCDCAFCVCRGECVCGCVFVYTWEGS